MAPRSTFRSPPKPTPEQVLKAAILLMEGVAQQLQPAEVQRLQHARAFVEARRQMPRELLLALQQDYMRVRSTQLQLVDATEELTPFLFPQELETVHTSRIALESGRLVPNDLIVRLSEARLRAALPTILEHLENLHAFMTDAEHHLVQQANLDLQTLGGIHPKVQQKILKLQQSIVQRQHMGMG